MRDDCVCEGGGLRAAFRHDLDRYVFVVQQREGGAGRLASLRFALLSQGLWATSAYRLNHYVRYRLGLRLLGAFPHILHRIIIAITGINIDRQAHIGPGLMFPHAGGIIVGPVRLGRNCDIFHGTTLGESSKTPDDSSSRPDVPTLGNRVWIGPGAVIAGGVTVADDAVVAANSLLVRDVPPRGVMIGVPARLVSRQGSFTQITYRDMDSDDERKIAMATTSEGSPELIA
jgi:serine O-acetyltransferase